MSLSDEHDSTQINTVSNLTLLGRLTSYVTWVSPFNLRWVPTSAVELEQSETKIFSFIKKNFKTYFVNVDENEKDLQKSKNKLWTIEMEDVKENKEYKHPIVLIHGFASGIGFWTLNLDAIAEHRKVYAFDLLGFGRSSRPNFKPKLESEEKLIDSIETWRKNVGLNNKFILLGHSFGAYVAMSYALKYPDYIETLVLADPWGFSKIAVSPEIVKKIPLWAKTVFRLLNPLAVLRISGPFGPKLISVRDDLRKKFVPLMGEEDSQVILKYAYHCNADKPSGEIIFRNICNFELSAKRPLIERETKLKSEINLHFIYAENSWLFREEKENILNVYPDNKVEYTILKNAGHHLYSDNSEDFNSVINNL